MGDEETKTKRKRSANGEAKPYQRAADGMWCIAVELPSPDGRRRRKVLVAKTEGAVKEKEKKAKRELIVNGDIFTNGQTLETWLRVWFRDIALKKLRPRTAATYESYMKNHIVPSIGKVRLDKLTPAHVRKLHNDMTSKGLSSTSAGQAHRILAVALKYAEQDGRVTRNVANLTDAPRKAATDLVALDVSEGRRVLEAAADDHLGSLWWAVLLTGARQGELLGLTQDRVTDSLNFAWQLQRISWRHGCNPLGSCGRKRGTDCPQRTILHAANWEHTRLEGGLYLSRPKSDSGWRIIPLVEPLKSVLELQIEANQSKPNPHNLVWSNPDGSPIDPRAETEAWDALLKRAKVPDVRLHDGRHTTVDLLFEAGVPEQIIMDIVGHSSLAMTRKYRSKQAKAVANRPQLTDALGRLAKMLTTESIPNSVTR